MTHDEQIEFLKDLVRSAYTEGGKDMFYLMKSNPDVMECCLEDDDMEWEASNANQELEDMSDAE